MNLSIKLIAGSVLALMLGLAVASPILVPNLTVGVKAKIGVDVVYAYFGVQQFNSSISGLWRTQADSSEPYVISYFIVLNVTNNSDDSAVIEAFKVAAAPEIDLSNGTLIRNGIVIDARDLRRGYVLWDMYWAPKTSRLIGFTGMATLPEILLAPLRDEMIYLLGQAEGRPYGGGSESTANGLKYVQFQRIGDEFLYNTVVSENQLLQIDRNGIDVHIETRR